MNFKTKCSIKLFSENKELIYLLNDCFLIVNREFEKYTTKEGNNYIPKKITWSIQINDVLDFKYFGKILFINIIDIENIEYSGNILYISNFELKGTGILNGLT